MLSKCLGPRYLLISGRPDSGVATPQSGGLIGGADQSGGRFRVRILGAAARMWRVGRGERSRFAGCRLGAGTRADRPLDAVRRHIHNRHLPAQCHARHQEGAMRLL